MHDANPRGSALLTSRRTLHVALSLVTFLMFNPARSPANNAHRGDKRAAPTCPRPAKYDPKADAVVLASRRGSNADRWSILRLNETATNTVHRCYPATGGSKTPDFNAALLRYA